MSLVSRFFVPLCAILLFAATAQGSPSQHISDGEIKGDPFADDSLFSTDPGGDSGAAGRTDGSGEYPLDLQLHGYLESRNRLRITDSRVISARQRLWLEGGSGFFAGEDTGASAPLRLFASGAVDVDTAAADLSNDTEPARVYLEEAYLTLDRTWYKVVLGQKIQRIGTGDGINPLDLINPIDYRDPVANGRSDARLPVPLGLFTLNLPLLNTFQEASVDAVVVPLAKVNILNAPGSPWESPGLKELRAADASGLIVLRDQQEPDRFLENAELELRLAATVSGWDLALVGFYGYLDSPVFASRYVAEPDGQERLYVTPVHPSFSAVGINFAKGLERSTIRGELALKPDLPVMLKDTTLPGYERRAVVEGVIGVDRTFGINLYTNLQYFCTYTEHAGELVNRTYSHGLTYEIHDLFLDDDLEAGLRGIISFSGQGETIEAYAQYKLADDWLFEGSLLFFQGDESGAYGQFNNNDSLTLRIRYTF